MNKGFMLYEAIIMLGIINFIISSCLTLNYQMIVSNKRVEKNIEKLISKKLTRIRNCDRECMIKKALHQLK